MSSPLTFAQTVSIDEPLESRQPGHQDLVGLLTERDELLQPGGHLLAAGQLEDLPPETDQLGLHAVVLLLADQLGHLLQCGRDHLGAVVGDGAHVETDDVLDDLPSGRHLRVEDWEDGLHRLRLRAL